jgi:hypothetical protein
LGVCTRSWSTTRPSRCRASAAVAAVKLPRIAPETSGCWARVTWPSVSRRKWTVQRCHEQPSTWAIACLSRRARR